MRALPPWRECRVPLSVVVYEDGVIHGNDESSVLGRESALYRESVANLGIGEAFGHLCDVAADVECVVDAKGHDAVGDGGDDSDEHYRVCHDGSTFSVSCATFRGLCVMFAILILILIGLIQSVVP